MSLLLDSFLPSRNSLWFCHLQQEYHSTISHALQRPLSGHAHGLIFLQYRCNPMFPEQRAHRRHKLHLPKLLARTAARAVRPRDVGALGRRAEGLTVECYSAVGRNRVC